MKGPPDFKKEAKVKGKRYVKIHLLGFIRPGWRGLTVRS